MPQRAGKIAVIVLAAVLAVIGAILLGGGAYLIILGGSWYYALAGIALIASGVLLFRFSVVAVAVYTALWLATLFWTLWEVQFDWWAWVPRMVAPSVLLILVLLCLPAITTRRPAARSV